MQLLAASDSSAANRVGKGVIVRFKRDRRDPAENYQPASIPLLLSAPLGLAASVAGIFGHGVVKSVGFVVSIGVVIYVIVIGSRIRRRRH